MNKVILIGNLTRDTELNNTSGGIARCTFGLAVNRSFANSNGEREVDFFNIVAWRGLGENCHKYLKKGSKVGISGSIQMRSYEVDGQKRMAVDILASDVEFLSIQNNSDSSSTDNAPPQRKVSELTPVDDDSLPF